MLKVSFQHSTFQKKAVCLTIYQAYW